MKLTVGGSEVFVHGLRELDRTRRSMVLVHGAGCDHSVWRYQTRRMIAAGLGALAPDLPGHGRSGGEPLSTIPEMGRWLVDLIRVLDLDRPVLVGHSMGSLAVLNAAAQSSAPAGVVLLGAADRMAVHPDLLQAATEGDHRAVELIVGWSVVGDQRLGGHPSPGTWTRSAITRLFEQSLARNLGVDLAACDIHDPVVDAKAVTCPTLIINGTADLMTSISAARTLSEALADVRIVAVEGGSHMVMYEDPKRVNNPLIEWTSSLAVDGGDRPRPNG